MRSRSGDGEEIRCDRGPCPDVGAEPERMWDGHPAPIDRFICRIRVGGDTAGRSGRTRRPNSGGASPSSNRWVDARRLLLTNVSGRAGRTRPRSAVLAVLPIGESKCRDGPLDEGSRVCRGPRTGRRDTELGCSRPASRLLLISIPPREGSGSAIPFASFPTSRTMWRIPRRHKAKTASESPPTSGHPALGKGGTSDDDEWTDGFVRPPILRQGAN